MSTSKISVIGTGNVGSALGFALVIRELCDELVLVNRTANKAAGEAADLRHAAAFVSRSMKVSAGDVDATANSDIVVVTNSIPMEKDFSDRLALAKGNVELFRQWIPRLADASPNAVLVIVTNPVDVLTYVAVQLSGFPASRVVGTGTLIDSVRYRSLLSSHLSIHPEDIRAYILGEHGKSQFPALSIAATGGRSLDADKRIETLFEEARESGIEVFRQKGYTNYAIALATTLIVESVIRDSRRTLPVSTMISDYYGVEDLCLSVPAVLGRGGVQKILRPNLSESEVGFWRSSAQQVRDVLDQNWP